MLTRNPCVVPTLTRRSIIWRGFWKLEICPRPAVGSWSVHFFYCKVYQLFSNSFDICHFILKFIVFLMFIYDFVGYSGRSPKVFSTPCMVFAPDCRAETTFFAGDCSKATTSAMSSFLLLRDASSSSLSAPTKKLSSA